MSLETSPQTAVQDWASLLGPAAVRLGADIPASFRTDTSIAQRRVLAVLQVERADQVPQVMRIAARHRCCIHPVSTGKNWGYGSALPASHDVVMLDLSRLQGIDFDPELGVATVEPGVTQAMLADAIRGHGFMVPTTGAGGLAGLLSNALERGYGITPVTDHFSAVTDIEAVLADGSVYRSALHEAGSPQLARLFKWGIGPYVNGLFSQSGFGIVTRVTILLARRPEAVKVCLFNLKDDRLLDVAVDRIRQVLQTLPGIVGGVNLMNQHRVLAMTAPYPQADGLDSAGLMTQPTIARLGRQYQIAPWTGFATLYGSAQVVRAAQREIKRILSGVASRLLFISPGQAAFLERAAGMLPGAAARKLASTLAKLNASMALIQGEPNEATALPLTYWRSRTTRPPTGMDPARDGCGLLWYAPLVPMRAADVRRFINFAQKELVAHGLEPTITLTSQGDRLFDCTIPLLFDLGDAQAARRAHECLDHLTRAGRELGFYPYRLHVDAMQAHADRHPASGALIDRLRRAWDPDDLIAPGRYR